MKAGAPEAPPKTGVEAGAEEPAPKTGADVVLPPPNWNGEAPAAEALFPPKLNMPPVVDTGAAAELSPLLPDANGLLNEVEGALTPKLKPPDPELAGAAPPKIGAAVLVPLAAAAKALPKMGAEEAAAPL